VIDLVSQLDEEFSQLFSGKNTFEFWSIMSQGGVHVYDQLALANTPLDVHIFLG
jgi:hypothetical protein